MIYFIYDSNNNAVKIGKTNKDSLYVRLSMIQVGNPNELTILGVMDGDLDKEQELHQEFKKYYIRGEWFTYSDEIKEYVSTNTKEPVVVEGNKWSTNNHLKRKYNKQLTLKNHEHYVNTVLPSLHNYFELDAKAIVTNEEIQECCRTNNIMNKTKTNVIKVSDIAAYFKLKCTTKRIGKNIVGAIKGLKLKTNASMVVIANVLDA